jgi:hypothetical protein
MSNKKQTAVSQVILKMKDAKENFPSIGFDEEFVRGFNKAFQMAIFISEKVGLPLEKEQIIDAAKSCVYIGGATNEEAEQYFTQTFQTNE